jgi:hypothetical protein
LAYLESRVYAGPKEKTVTAGLARLNLLDDSHENGRSNGKSEYCGIAVCYLDQDDSTSMLTLNLVCMPITFGSKAYASTTFTEDTKLCTIGLASTKYLAGLIIANTYVHANNSEYLRAYASLLLKG